MFATTGGKPNHRWSKKHLLKRGFDKQTAGMFFCGFPRQLRHAAATRIQALCRGRQVRAKATLMSVAQVGMLRIKAMRHGHSPYSPSPTSPSPTSPMLQEAQKTFLETPRSPRTQGESLRAALRLQALFRGNQVRSRLEAQRQAATKIQAQFRGRKGRLLAMDLASATGPMKALFQRDTASQTGQ